MPASRSIFKSEKFYFVIFVIMSAAGVLFNLPYCYDKIITYDSAYQYFLTMHSWKEIWRLLPEDYSPPLYAMLVKLSCVIFGHTFKVMMFTNSAVIVGLVFIALFPMRKAFGARAGIVAAFFYICSSINSSLFRETRPTFWAYLFITGTAVYAYLAFFEGKKKYYICHAVFSLLAMYTHNVAMIGALGIYVTLLVFSLLKKDKKRFLSFFISGAVCGLLYIPWLLVVFKQFGNVKEHYWSERYTTPLILKDYLYNSIILDRFPKTVPPFIESTLSLCLKLLAVVFLFKSLGIKKGMKTEDLKKAPLFSKEMKGRFFKGIFVLLLLVLPIGIFELITRTVYPLSANRYYYIFTGITILIIAVFTTKVEKKIVPFFLSVLITVNACAVHYTIHQDYIDAASDIDKFTEMLNEENPDGNIAFLHSHEWTLGVMSYYFPNAQNYMYDGTWTVLNDLSVFPNVAAEIGDENNMKEYADVFYTFKPYYIDSSAEKDLEEFFKNSPEYECLYTKGFLYTRPKIVLLKIRVRDKAEENE